MNWKDRPVLVTGGASFIGSHLVDGLIERGAAVRVVDDLSSGQLDNIKDHIDKGRVEFIRGDLKTNGLARKVVDGMSVVFHLAADHGGRGYVELHQSACALNMMLDQLVFDTAAKARVDKVVFASSGCVYPNELQTDPSQTVGISGRVPQATSDGMRRALDYMGLKPGDVLEGLPVGRVFIGSCTNARLPDLEAAAVIVRGRKVAPDVTALVVPGSTSVKRAAEARGLDAVFKDAGFLWGESGCSMCAGGNGDRGLPQERCVSTTNRNFENRQGTAVRTHLASPATVAATAIAGRIVDVRKFLAGGAP